MTANGSPSDIGAGSSILSEEVSGRRTADIAAGSSPYFVDDDVQIGKSTNIRFRPATEAPESLLWPQETVFVPSGDYGDDAAIENPELAESTFEDAQADDVFEQSLKIPISPEIVALRSSLKKTTTGPEVEETQDNEIEKEPSDKEDAVFANKKTSTYRAEKTLDLFEPRRSGHLFLRIIGFSTLLVAVFAAGIGVGAWLFRTPSADVQVPGDPTAPSMPAQPVPPPGMAYVPGGEFIMGADTGDEFSRPAHRVTVEPFFMDLTDVANEEYKNFTDATGRKVPPDWSNGTYPDGKGQFPVTGVTWYDAAAYADWAGKRLPTEEEWEFAARGTDGRIYPWGNEWDPRQAGVDHNSVGLRKTGEGAKSPFGLSGMSGNAWDWTASDARAYPGGKEFPGSKLHLKIIRGGNWQSDSRTASAAFRGFYGALGEPEYKSTSFRCVKDTVKE